MTEYSPSSLGNPTVAAGQLLTAFRSQTASLVSSIPKLKNDQANRQTYPRQKHDVRVLGSIRDIERAQWNAIVDRSRNGTIFHRHEWLEAVERALDAEPVHIVITKDGNPIGVFPNVVTDIPKTPFRRLTSARPEFGGPLLPTDTQEVLPIALETARQQCNGRRIVHEIRAHELNYHRFADPLWFRGYRPYIERTRHLLDLRNGYDDFLAGLRNNRQRALREGWDTDHEIVDEEVTSETLERFHRTYKAVMERVGGDVFPRSFFEQLATMEDNVLFRSIYIDGSYAGGMFDLIDHQQSTVYGFKMAISQAYFRQNATELLAAETIKRAIDNGFDTYDLGTTRPNYQEGLFRHKISFGSDIVPVVTWERGTSTVWPIVRIARRRYLSKHH